MSQKKDTAKTSSEAQTITKADVGSLEDVLGATAEVKPDVAQEVEPEVAAKTNLVEVPYLDMFYVQLDPPAQINALVGNPAAGGWAELDRQLGVVRGEWNELVLNVEKRDYATIMDDIADLQFTLIGFAYAAGALDVFNENWHRVCGSQYSKFDRNPQDAERTLEKYSKKGIQAHTVEVLQAGTKYYVTKATVDQPDPDRNGDLIKAGKWLKSINYVEPTLVLPSAEIQAKFAVPSEA